MASFFAFRAGIASFETLESRQLLSGSVSALCTSTPTATVALVHQAAHKTLRPAQVLGTYSGNADVNVSIISVSKPVTLELHKSGSKYAGTMTVNGYGSFQFTVTEKQLLKIRQGKSTTINFNKNGEHGTVTVTLSKDAKSLSGDFSASGNNSADGSFDLTKNA